MMSCPQITQITQIGQKESEGVVMRDLSARRTIGLYLRRRFAGNLDSVFQNLWNL
jgi:hypothetical protein